MPNVRKLCVFLWWICLTLVINTPRGYSQQSKSNGVPAQQPSVTPPEEEALEDPVLEDADEDREVPYIESRLTLKYSHVELTQHSWDNLVRIFWLESLGTQKRVAVSIELPYVNFERGNGGPSSNAFGDMKVAARYAIGRGEKFTHAAEVEFTLPTASDDAFGARQSIFRGVWGFSAQITGKTLLSGNLGYNKGFNPQTGVTAANTIEPEVILSHAFHKRIGGYLDYDTVYDFNSSRYVDSLKAGIDVLLGKKENWSVSPYCKFPVSETTEGIHLRYDVGFDLTYRM